MGGWGDYQLSQLTSAGLRATLEALTRISLDLSVGTSRSTISTGPYGSDNMAALLIVAIAIGCSGM